MGRFTKTEYKDTVNSIIGSVKETINNPYYLWANKSPTIVDYYSIDKKASTLDEGSLIDYSPCGYHSPIKYNLVKDFLVYGIEQIQVALTNDEFGLQSDIISGDAFVLPNTITPCSGDYFSITYLKEKFIFKVMDVSFDTMDNGSNMYKFMYELSSDQKLELEKCVTNTYTFIVQNVGTEFNCIIKDSTMDQLTTIDETIELLKEYFISLYYNERVQTFVYRFLEHNFYDPYMIQFLMDNEILNYKGSDYVYIGHQTPINNLFPIKYRKTFFSALENKDLNIRNYENKAMATLITNRMTTFYNRPEAYFEINYEPMTKEWGIVPTFFDELFSHIEENVLFTENDGNFYVYNIIIKYFNNETIDSDDLNLVKQFNFQYHHMLFYAIPAVIFCLNKKLDSLMEKE